MMFFALIMSAFIIVNIGLEFNLTVVVYADIEDVCITLH